MSPADGKKDSPESQYGHGPQFDPFAENGSNVKTAKASIDPAKNRDRPVADRAFLSLGSRPAQTYSNQLT